jgi:UDP-N-acetylmuramoyl-tripeptide--D-alanyl-D-alanine ligase
MKRFARSIVGIILGWQVRRLQKKHSFTTVAVVGSIGKTSTKFAIAQVLGESLRVRFQSGNYNDYVSVPLVAFGLDMPSLFNPFAWLAAFIRCELQIHKTYPYDVVVLELGTDGPGQIAAFGKYLHVDIAVLTSVAPEHMEFFADLDEVAKEELSVIQFSKQLVLNADLVAKEYRSLVPEALSYSLHEESNYKISNFKFVADGVKFELDRDGEPLISADHSGISEPHLYSLTAAAAVADLLELHQEAIIKGFEHVKPVSGRMQRLDGIKGSTIIDDSYNASPEAVKAALETLYRIESSKKIALLGNMNELGDFSVDAHTKIGNFCDPKQLSEVITLGPDANEHLAPAAELQGCKVTRFTTPYEAGEYLGQIVSDGAVVLVKGSQNRVYAEEAIKSILANPADEGKLVRQSSSWLKKKAQNFR